MKKLSSIIASPSDRENIVIEIWAEDVQVAEVSREPGSSTEIDIFPPAAGTVWHFNLDEFRVLLDQAAGTLNTLE